MEVNLSRTFRQHACFLQRAGEPAAGMQRPGYASSIPPADKLAFKAAAPAYSGLAASQLCRALPFPSDDAMCCSSSATGQKVQSPSIYAVPLGVMLYPTSMMT